MSTNEWLRVLTVMLAAYIYNTLRAVVLLGNIQHRLYTTTSAVYKMLADLCDNLAHCNGVGGIYCTLPVVGFDPTTNV